MWNKETELKEKKNSKQGSKLSRQILGLIFADAGISAFIFVFLRLMAEGVVLSYCEKNNIAPTEMQDITIMTWVQNVSMAAAVLFFAALFFILAGEKLSYIREIIAGIEALRTHRMNYDIPLRDENELTELAAAINYLAETERQLKKLEAEMVEEREILIKDLSHDIRTPLTSILSYSEYLKKKDNLSQSEMMEFIETVQRKAEQIKVLTDRLLDVGINQQIQIDDGRLLLAQLCDEWLEPLEDHYQCRISVDECPSFKGQVDIQELRRIFDNLLSNVEKYADPQQEVGLIVGAESSRLAIEQYNAKKLLTGDVESTRIGLESIRRIAEKYGGAVDIAETEESFRIKITLFSI